MGLWKFFRIFLTALSLLIILATSGTDVDLFRSSTVFLLGLLYDYASMFNAVAKNKWLSYDKIHSCIGLGIILWLLLISILGVTGILLTSKGNPSVWVFGSGSQDILKHLVFNKNYFFYFLVTLLILVVLELSNPMERTSAI
ncbi:hypothetical protein [Desulfosporosinus sp. SB140]|uniref:hypothetical protein n=1 Tax=Desulfosporosinus paludis TaxID=3115649 RepID=UPI0038905318